MTNSSLSSDRVVPLSADALAVKQVGDVIQMSGDSIPRALWKCWFRIDAKDGDQVTLSAPYVDAALTLPFQWHGSQRGSALALERRSRRHRA